jgi:hypothetical protein
MNLSPYERRASCIGTVPSTNLCPGIGRGSIDPREITFDLNAACSERLRSLFGGDESRSSNGRHRLRLEPLGCDSYRFG